MFNRIPLGCFLCGTPLSGGIDTWGDVGQECCQSCHWDLMGEDRGTAWFGLAPHKHDLSLTGSIVGSTVFDLLPEPPTLNGSYYIESHKAWFTPDKENSEMGMWHTD